ncbi:MAG: hypothetical protein Q8936_19490 [Bacillota bacterium]|nr:hypothetical protein [Bacillota bacterium]
MNDKSYFTSKSKVFAYAIQFVTDKQYYKFTKDGKIIYSFEINDDEKEKFYNKLRQLENVKFS